MSSEIFEARLQKSLGNHEFDSSPDGLEPFLEEARFPVLAANLNFTNEPSLVNLVKKSVVLEVKGTKVGVIGFLTPETIQISQTRAVIFSSEINSLIEESERLDKQGVKVIIALGHSGFTVDQEIAAKVPLVDVVVGGHTNTFLWNGKAPDLETPEDMYPKVVTQKSGKKVPVVQAYAYTKYMGVLNVTFNDQGDLVEFYGQPILLDHTIPQDKDVLDMLEPYRVRVAELSKQVIGKTKVLLDGDANRCRMEECNFGNLLADSLVQYVASLTGGKFWTKVPIGLVNGGGIRNSIDPAVANGNITRADVMGALPFDNRIITLEIMGDDLLQVLEQGARFDGISSRGEFLQVSGLKYTVDWSKPPMHRISNVKARCGNCWIPRYLDLDPKETYNVVSISFLTEGGDGHTILKTKSFNQKTEDLNDVDIVQWYLEKYSPVYPEVQGRITIVGSVILNSSPALSCSMVLIWIVFIISKLVFKYNFT
ncbi:unnamed protein product [Brassicogethes aeneus]|uniref:5'-nucleotidase n=1 Tax=Brassicogethes aeneus TaxID=1431903 RepID=A0A9P0BHJ4_BRAAE|nr:unnamed protein product [Brassicogethes aeneus]